MLSLRQSGVKGADFGVSLDGALTPGAEVEIFGISYTAQGHIGLPNFPKSGQIHDEAIDRRPLGFVDGAAIGEGEGKVFGARGNIPVAI